MAEISTLARPYAKAAFAQAMQSNEVEKWSTSLNLLAKISLDQKMRRYIDDPSKSSDRQAQAVIATCDDVLDTKQRNFIALLAENKRLIFLPEIAEIFAELRSEQEQALSVEIISAFPITPAEESMFKSALEKKFSKEIALTHRVDTTLKGGAIIRAGDVVIDGSAQGRLEKLNEVIGL